jgi:aminoglycoside phosphotransferase (APT) family kinase protein
VSDDPVRPRMHADEVGVDDDLVRGLLADQFPSWAGASLRRLPDSGTDNAIYRLGDDLGIRLPRIHWAVDQIDKEFQWLERLAPHLPTRVPVPLAKGEPGRGYPFPWLVYPWLPGASLSQATVGGWPDVVRDVGEFVLALERAPVDGAPPPRRRGAPMAPHDREVRRAIERLDGLIDPGRGLRVWQEALDAGPWVGDPVWVHGDLLPGNVLVHEDRVSGVIDWSGAGIGDPACDAMLAWSLSPDSRHDYRTVVGFDDATWARARGWVVEQTAFFIPYYATSLPRAVDEAKRRLVAALTG